MENIVHGPYAPLNNKEFGNYLFKTLASQDPNKSIVVNADTKEELTIAEFRTKCIQAAYRLKQYVKQGDIIVCICNNEWISLVPMFASLYLGSTISVVNPIYNASQVPIHKHLTAGIKFLEDIPQNSNGKIIKCLLRDIVTK